MECSVCTLSINEKNVESSLWIHKYCLFHCLMIFYCLKFILVSDDTGNWLKRPNAWIKRIAIWAIATYSITQCRIFNEIGYREIKKESTEKKERRDAPQKKIGKRNAITINAYQSDAKEKKNVQKKNKHYNGKRLGDMFMQSKWYEYTVHTSTTLQSLKSTK